MVEKIINEVMLRGGMTVENLRIVLNDYTIEKKSTAITVAADARTEAVKMFLVTKRVEGCTDNTLKYYAHVLRHFFSKTQCGMDQIKDAQIRYYLAVRGQMDKLSKTSQDNELRVLKSFFGWCSAEEYITKDPTRNVKAVKKEKRIKKAFSEMELEKIRNNAGGKRNLAIIETLYFTGCRVSELCAINISDIDGDEITVFGKGEKERIVYLNAKSRFAIEAYLEERLDKNPALFVSLKSPYIRLKKGSVEWIIREIGKKSGVENCHPHRFRRTAASLALNRGMPIEQVQKMLGHEKIETTTIYARSDLENVKASHRKYVT